MKQSRRKKSFVDLRRNKEKTNGMKKKYVMFAHLEWRKDKGKRINNGYY